MPDPKTTLLWFRQDLRLADHAALQAAIRRGGEVLPVFIDSQDEEGSWAAGGASRWWLHHSLQALAESLGERGAKLVIRKGPALRELSALLRETGADAVFWSRRYEPAAVARDHIIKQSLSERGIDAESHNAALLFEPWQIKNKSGEPFKVFTPYWNACLRAAEPEAPLPMPKKISGFSGAVASLALKELGLEPSIDWAAGIRAVWQPGEAGAARELKRFIQSRLEHYLEGRDRPDDIGTSRLSPHLHFGEIGPRQIWHAVKAAELRDKAAGLIRNGEGFLREIGWREFAHQLLFHFPQTSQRCLRPEFERFPWQRDARGLRAWQRGRTGYPLVDAGMRQLWESGWMHNRVRMIVASFLVKDLRIDWREGAKWFWDTLVDADLANNTLGWQWSAGCGADAAPYFRIFNPMTQGEKFDPNGDYIRQYLPELKTLDRQWIHRPWMAPAEVLTKAGIALGKDYPFPIVDHALARNQALAALQTLKAK